METLEVCTVGYASFSFRLGRFLEPQLGTGVFLVYLVFNILIFKKRIKNELKSHSC
jgi:hypothetical protein